MFEDNAITHRYSGRFTTSVSASRADYSISDGSSFGSELSVEFVGNTLFSVRGSKFSSANYSNQLNTSYRVGASQSLFSKRLSNKVYQDFSSGGSSGVTSSSSSGWGFSSPSSSAKAGSEGSGTGRPTGGATGELDDSFASPVGDVLLPLLLMAAAYAVVRWFKNWKRKRTRNRLFCIK